ncbi:beta-galactosidase BoGH2A precursor [Clostridium puniceum]|uniref:Beta-galactosidase BoGH2A n=1 Tax=Clostridium puniceum TaxID=29367 RepID=A0A1S8SXN1_9CLOT|nr:glycoside hydrolase family 2 TIM barrel-domain containing protein [Clostridium puniceum]OOM70025.1 beta-galactosidase BoGH2A precursor [Clostridium puniceum]
MKKQHFYLDWNFSYSTGNSYQDKNGGTFKEKVNLPHDFSIGLDRTPQAGANEAGGFFQGGIGTYQKEFYVSEEQKDKEFLLVIEGAYMNTEVYINGNLAMLHPYGYTEFHVKLNHWLKYGENNKLKIVVNNNAMPNSRWYSGSGLYRHVWLMTSEAVYLAPWSISIATPTVAKEKALVKVETNITNDLEEEKQVSLVTTLFDKNGEEVTSYLSEVLLEGKKETKLVQELFVTNPKLWSLDSPTLYEAVSQVKLGDVLLDETKTTFGIRTISFSAKDGFKLNDATIKLKGGCLHHDNGPIGACAFDVAEERKVRIMKEVGYNAIRTAHNPPSTALLEACDRLGILVMDEVFDCWRLKKNTYDYHLYFEDWWKKDLEAMILRDRNHPSVIMWSIGNEIGERDGSSNGAKIAKELADYARSLDDTRAITNGVCAIFLDAGEFGGILANIFNGSAGDLKDLPPEVHELLKECDRVTAEWGEITADYCSPLDVVGYNYLDNRYEQDGKAFPDRVICGTESYPKKIAAVWEEVLKHNHVIGDFSWTSMDYFGEAGIGRSFYDETGSLFADYSWHISNCGDIDICGEIKPQGEYRKVVWGERKTPYIAVLKPEHYGKKEIVSSWGWSDVERSWSFPEAEGKKVRVDVYSNAEEIALIINGKVVERKAVGTEEAFKVSFDVVYEKGTIEAVAYTNNVETERDKLETVGKQTSLILKADISQLTSGYQGLSYVTCEVVDDRGRLVPHANNAISIEVTGEGNLQGMGTGNPISTEGYVGPSRNAYNGKVLAVVRSKEKGKILVTARAEGLAETILELESI